MSSRWSRRLRLAALLLLLLGVAAVGLLQLPPVATWVTRRLITLAPLSPGYRIEVARVSGNWFSHLRLEQVRLLQGRRELAAIDRLSVGYDLHRLAGGETRLAHLTAAGVRATARRTADGWDLADVLRPSPDTASAGGPFLIDRVDLDDVDLVARMGRDSVLQVRHLRLRARRLVMGERLLVVLDTVSAAVSPPSDPPLWLELAARGAATREVLQLEPLRIHTGRSEIAGRVVIPRSFDDPRIAGRLSVRLEALPLALADLAAVYPAVPPDGTLRLEADATARGRLATATLAARLDDATLRLTGATLLGHDAPAVVRLRGDVARLDPSRLHRSAPAARLTGGVEADLRGPSLAESDGSAALRLKDSRVGASAVKGLDLRATVHQGRADLVLRGDLAGAAIRVEGWARPFDSTPAYRLSGRARDLPGTATLARALAGKEGDPVLGLGFRLEGEGAAAEVARVSGRVDLAAVRRQGGRIELGHATLRLADRRLEVRPVLLVAGGRVTGLALATVGDTITYEVRDGRLAEVDLGRLLGDTVVAPLSGRFSLRGRGSAPAEARVVARVELDRLEYGDRRLDRVAGSIRLAGGRAELDLAGGLQGGTLALAGSGRPFDSVPAFEIQRVALDRVDLGTLLGRPDLAGPVTLRASGRGRWGSGVRSVRGRATVEPSRLGRIEVAGGRLSAALEGERLTYDADLSTSGGSLALAGDGRPLAGVPALAVRHGRADSLDLGVLLGRSGLATAISARFTAAVAGAGADSLRGRLALDLLPSRVNDGMLDSGRARLALEGGALSGDLRVRGEDAELDARLSGRTGDRSLLRADGTVRVERLARWTRNPKADGRLEGRFGLEARADTAGLLSLGGSVTAAGGVGEVRLHTVYLALTPAPGTLTLDTLVLRSNVAALDGAGTLALRGPGTGDSLRLQGWSRDLAPLAALAGLDSLSLDSTRLAVAVAGPAHRWRVRGRAEAWRLLYGSTLAEHVVARGGATMDSAGPGGFAGDLRLEGASAGQVTIEEAQVSARYDSLVALEGSAVLGNGGVRLWLGLTGATRGDTLRARLGRLELVEGGRTWSLARPAAIATRPGVVEVDRLVLGAGDRSLSLDGTLDRHGTSDLTLRLTNLDLDALEAARISPVAGRLDGELHLSGPAAAPELAGQVGLTVREQGAAALGHIESKLAWTRTGLRIAAAASHNRGGRLTVDGTLPWRLTLVPADTAARLGLERSGADTMALAVRADSFDLALFRPLLPEESARDLRGRLAMDARVGGTPDRPGASGTVGLTGLAVTLPSLGLDYREGILAGRFDGDRFTLDSLALSTGKDERMVARGTLLLRPLADPTLDLTARLHDFRISNAPPLRGVASGDIALAGTAGAPVLTGELTLGPSEVVVGAEAGAGADKVQLTEQDLREVARYFGPGAVARGRAGPGLVDRFRLDLEVTFPRRVWFRRKESPQMNIELAGKIQVRQEPGQEMQFFGTVEPVPGRGGLDLYGRTFELTRGDITLRGPAAATTLDVTAQYQVPTSGAADDAGVLIDVEAKGRPDSLQLAFSAEPALSQEDIISYIVTGRPSSDSPLEQQGSGVEGGQLALNTLSEALAGEAGQKLGFDVFQIRQNGAQGLTLTAGRYVASRLFVSLQQPLQTGGTSEASATQTSGPGFELEYGLRRWLRATLRGGSLPPGLLFRGRYAY